MRARVRKPSPSEWKARQAVGNRLRELRGQAGLTMLSLARRCDWHEAKISRIENAYTPPSPDDIRAWCTHCGAPGEADRLIESLRAAEELLRGWPSMESAGLAPAQHAVLHLWEHTLEFRAYSSGLVPGAVQTRDYTRSVLKLLAAHRDLPDDTRDATAARVDRQRLLLQGGRKCTVLIEEHVLGKEVGSPAIMSAQLAHLLALMTHPTLTLAIIPNRAKRTTLWPIEDFWIFDQDQANVELASGWLTHDRDTEIARYEKAWNDLYQLAVQGAQARALIAAAVNALPD